MNEYKIDYCHHDSVTAETGSQFNIIASAKQALLDSTNIDTSPNEMACLNDFLFRCWQMGWLDKYGKDVVEVVRCKDCVFYEAR